VIVNRFLRCVYSTSASSAEIFSITFLSCVRKNNLVSALQQLQEPRVAFSAAAAAAAAEAVRVSYADRCTSTTDLRNRSSWTCLDSPRLPTAICSQSRSL